MTKFRPCIDLHEGQVKQIVGGTLSTTESNLKTNFVSTKPSKYFADLYKKNNLTGAHLIKLGRNNDEAALSAVQAWHDSLQVGGGINLSNANEWIDKGAAKVIVTSYLFPKAQFDEELLRGLSELIGKERLVVDISCRREILKTATVDPKWIVAIDKWQTRTEYEVNEENMDTLHQYCSEFLIHAADVEGLCQGIDEELVSSNTSLILELGVWAKIDTTYAGGAKGNFLLNLRSW